MKNSEYWHRRMISLENTQYKKNIEYFEELERIYQRAIWGTELDLSKWYLRFAKNNEISMAEAKRRLNTKELEEFKWLVADYIKYGKENAINHQWMKELENASARYHISRLESLKLQMQNHIEVLIGMQEDGITDLMRNHLENGYYQTIFELQKGFGVGTVFSRLDRQMIGKVLQKPWAADGANFSERIWKQREQLVNDVYNRLVQGIICGQHPNKIVKGMAEKFNVRKSAAKNLILTESAYFRSEAQKQAYKELGVKEFEIDAALDSRTCSVCGDMDGKHMPLSDHIPGVTSPPFHPRCRCCTVPFFDDDIQNELEAMTGRSSRNTETGKTEIVNDMTYAAWRKKFIDVPKDKAYNKFKEEAQNIILSQYAVKLNKGQQDKHIPGTNNYIDGRSILTADPEELIRLYAGKGYFFQKRNGDWKERTWFRHNGIIGIYKNPSGVSMPTDKGIMHYSKKNGIHIIPADPKGEWK